MEQQAFESLVNVLVQASGLPDALTILKASTDQEISQAATALAGQFAVAEIDGVQQIYHQFIEEDEHGIAQEFVDHIMNVDDDVILFVAWFFYTQFEITHRETYAAAGRTYTPSADKK